jgi:NAD(P)H-quinone oxidoreductase subunit 5
MSYEQLYDLLGMVVVAAPFALVLLLGVAALANATLPERVIGTLVQCAIVTGLTSSLIILGMMLLHGERHVPIRIGEWVQLGQPAHAGGHGDEATYAASYHFSLKLVFDRLSVPFTILTFLLCGTIGAFANRYMHRERGFGRFFVLYSFFVLGMVLAALAGTIETLFVGWELVGLSSTMLVAFYQERSGPVRNGLRVWSVYRLSDAALLIAAVIMHHYLRGHGDLDKLLGVDNVHFWPYVQTDLEPRYALAVGLLVLAAASGKSALIPFSGWLPRAMEGPTPSSAVFYGALSVHLGAYLLLRVSPILDNSPLLSMIVIALGLATAFYAAITARVQTDIKSALSFASLTQVGIIVTEIGIAGLAPWPVLRYVPLVHILGHACFRTLQFVRAPTVLYDYASLENAIGNRLPRFSSVFDSGLTPRTRTWLYRFALEKGYLDAWLADYLVKPILAVFEQCDRWERSWTDFLSRGPSRESDATKTLPSTVEELI